MAEQKLIPITFHTNTIKKLLCDYVENFDPNTKEQITTINLPEWVIQNWCKCDNQNYQEFLKKQTNDGTEKLARYIAIAIAVARMQKKAPTA